MECINNNNGSHFTLFLFLFFFLNICWNCLYLIFFLAYFIEKWRRQKSSLQCSNISARQLYVFVCRKIMFLPVQINVCDFPGNCFCFMKISPVFILTYQNLLQSLFYITFQFYYPNICFLISGCKLAGLKVWVTFVITWRRLSSMIVVKFFQYQTSHEWSLGGSHFKLYFIGLNSIQDGWRF